MGKKYSFTSFVTNPINFTLTIKNPNANVQNFTLRYKITHEFTAFIEKFSAAVGWILRLKVPPIKLTMILSIFSMASTNLKVNKIRILASIGGTLSLIENLKVNKLFLNASAKLIERWEAQTLKVKKFLITANPLLLGGIASSLKVNKITLTGNLDYVQFPFLSYYDTEYLDGYLDSMDISYLSDLDSTES